MARHPEPVMVTIWKRGEIPKCCHTCKYYTEDGLCEIFKDEPPKDFAETHEVCRGWKSFDGVPF